MRLINRNFTRLFYGQAVSVVGDFVFDTTLVLWIGTVLLPDNDYAPVAIAGVMIAVALGTLLVGPAAGVYVDRWNHRTTMMAADAARATLILLLAVVALLPSDAITVGAKLALIYTTVLLATGVAQFFNPSRFALLSRLVPETDRAKASGILQATGYTAAIVGPPLAAPLLFTMGAPLALFLNALSFMASFLLVRSVRPAPVPNLSEGLDASGTQEATLRRFISELRDGTRFVFGSPVLRMLLIAVAVAAFGAAALNELNVFFLPENLHAKASLYGTLGMGEGLGAVAGALAAGRLCRRFRDVHVFGVGLALVGLGLVFYARLETIWAAVPVIALIGVPLGAINAAMAPILLPATPEAYIGRAISTFAPVQQLASMMSAIGAGWLVSTAWRDFHHEMAGISFGRIDTVFLLAGSVIMISGLFATVALRKADPPAHASPTADMAAQRVAP
ncbi:MFS transporter [Streptomyces sp. col6]|uniref:MFS transporter n=1 Tax=Streptomyces sp. col6 TaxID=2478958 RepID=UPI0011CE21E4|nr:MFS transporter [Streptomyces sp. col6]TXR99735.1 MFS transporter [Streptomyces sp. col6]